MLQFVFSSEKNNKKPISDFTKKHCESKNVIALFEISSEKLKVTFNFLDSALDCSHL